MSVPDPFNPQQNPLTKDLTQKMPELANASMDPFAATTKPVIAEAKKKLGEIKQIEDFQAGLERILSDRRKGEEAAHYARGQEASARSAVQDAAERRSSDPSNSRRRTAAATNLGAPYGPVSGKTTLLGYA